MSRWKQTQDNNNQKTTAHELEPVNKETVTEKSLIEGAKPDMAIYIIIDGSLVEGELDWKRLE